MVSLLYGHGIQAHEPMGTIPIQTSTKAIFASAKNVISVPIYLTKKALRCLAKALRTSEVFTKLMNSPKTKRCGYKY